MGIHVMKFGGTSMADAERIRHAARHVAHEAGSGTHIAVVCSAMAGETNRLTHLAEEFQVSTSQDEYDAILASGEQVSSALMALALREEGLKARSWTGWQAGITTTGAHGHTRLGDCDLTHLKHRIEEGEIAVLTGFQGVSSERRITTLGRGGSDLSAVALAAALKADYCTIYTDVDGVYTADPRIEDKARRLDRLSFEEMLEMASVGAKVLQGRAAVLAMVHHVPLRIASSFSETGTEPEGTWVCDEEDIVEQRVVSGIAYSRHEAGLTLIGLPSHPEAKARIFNALARVHANIDMIVQSDTSQKERINLVLTVEKNDLSKAVRALETEQELYGFEKLVLEENIAKISVIGAGMRTHAGVADTLFSALAERGVSVRAVATSEIKISVLIDAEYVELAVRALHAAFGLDNPGTQN